MALSTRKKNIIIADWKTGKYRSFNAIAKQYKIAPKTARNLLSGIAHENAHIVDSLEVLKTDENSLKNSLKNPHDLKMVEKAVEDRLKVHIHKGKDEKSSFIEFIMLCNGKTKILQFNNFIKRFDKELIEAFKSSQSKKLVNIPLSCIYSLKVRLH